MIFWLPDSKERGTRREAVQSVTLGDERRDAASCSRGAKSIPQIPETQVGVLSDDYFPSAPGEH